MNPFLQPGSLVLKRLQFSTSAIRSLYDKIITNKTERQAKSPTIVQTTQFEPLKIV